MEAVVGNPVVHFELMSKNPAKLSDFYAKTFGWNIKNMPEINYRIVDTGEKPSGVGAMLFTDPEGRMMGLWKAKT